ncbi:hypothetical protein BaRGS_00032194 [Batillaria attramentaria]|uniref:Carbohydrate sulfotransferase n=1 Tax=Batillaria attramentaria TaxID=370345 RepID=A0ABD0JP49_9CAEN
MLAGSSRISRIWRPWLFATLLLALQSGIILKQSIYIHSIATPTTVSTSQLTTIDNSTKSLHGNKAAAVSHRTERLSLGHTSHQHLTLTQPKGLRVGPQHGQNLSYKRDVNGVPVNLPPSTSGQSSRLQLVRDTCHRYETSGIPGLVQKVYVYEAEKVAYCSTHKIASTYWLRVFRWLYNDTSRGHVNSPLDISKYETHLSPLKRLKTRDVSNNTSDRQLVESSYRFLFTREPYARLWSVYVDKFLLPDNYFWNHFAPKIKSSVYAIAHRKAVTRKQVNITAQSPSKQNSTGRRLLSLEARQTEWGNRLRGNDAHMFQSQQRFAPKQQQALIQKYCPTVTFHDFLQYIVHVATMQSGQALDDHFRPVHYGCNPCKFRPDFVGKIETMKEDSQQVLRRMRLDDIMDDLNPTDHVQQEINMLIDFNFQLVVKRKFQRTCVTDKELELRLIKAFIINGYIPGNSETILEKQLPLDQQAFEEAVLKLYRDSHRTSADIRQQRKGMKVKAYEKIPLDLLHSIRNIFRWDFELFGYDPEPPELFRK